MFLACTCFCPKRLAGAARKPENSFCKMASFAGGGPQLALTAGTKPHSPGVANKARRSLEQHTRGCETEGVVAIGASAGVIEALTELAAGLPSDLPFAVMVAVHLQVRRHEQVWR